MREFDKFEKYAFINLISWDKKTIIEKIINLPIYNDEKNLESFDNFITELYLDFKDIIPNYEFKDIIEYFLVKKNKPETIGYSKILSNRLISGSTINNFLKTNNQIQFENIIGKYSNIKLSDKQIPIDESIGITLCNKIYNISDLIISSHISDLTNTLSLKIEELIPFERLLLIIKNCSKTKNYLLNLLRGNKYLNNDEKKNFEDTIIRKTIINLDEIKQEINSFDYNQIYHIIIIKLLLINEIYYDIKPILSNLYCSSSIVILEMIQILKPELLDIDLELLKKIVFYGRFEVFEFLFFHIPWKILDLMASSNPLDLSIDNDYIYIDDIWNGITWDNHENAKPIIGKKNHKDLINLIIEIAKERGVTHIYWTNQIKKNWITLAIEFKIISGVFQDMRYFIKYSELVDIFELKFDFTNKQSIIQHIELFGKEATWDLIKNDCDENFLDLII